MAQSDNIIGIAMELDVEDLKAGLQETKKAITTANKEFANATAGMDDWKKSSEGIEAKLKQLDTVLVNQKKVVAGYEAELKRTVERFGENSEQARVLRDKLLDAETAVKKTEKAQRNFSAQLEEVKAAEKGVESSTDNMSSSMKKAEDATDDAKEGFTVLKATLADLISSGIQKLISSIQNLAKETLAFRKSMTRVTASFEDAGLGADLATDYFVKFNSILGDSSNATDAILMLSRLATSEEDLAEYTDILTGVYAELGSVIPTDKLIEEISKATRSAKASGKLAEALDWAGVATDDFNTALESLETEEERELLIRRTLSDAYLDAGERYRELNADIIANTRAETEYQLQTAKLGETATPIMTEYVKIKTRLMELVVRLVEYIKRNAPIIISLISGIGTALLVLNASAIVTALTGAIGKLRIAFTALNATMMANPMVLIAALIAGLVVAFATLWATSEDFRKFWYKLWDAVKRAVEPVVKFIVNLFSVAWSSIRRPWSEAVAFFTGIWDGIKGVFGGVVGFYKGIFGSAYNAITGIWDAIGGFFGGVVDTVLDAFESLPDAMMDIGRQAIDGLVEGITDAMGGAVDAIKDAVGGVVDGAKNLLGIRSPSRVMRDEVGRMIGEGIGAGILDSADTVNRDMREFIGGIQAGLDAKIPSITVDGGVVAGRGQTIVNNSYVQTINAPKQPSRLELYRQTKNLLSYATYNSGGM